MAFEKASTNLVAELGAMLAVLMGRRYARAEFVRAPIMVVVLLVFVFEIFLKPELNGAKTQVDRGILGSMEGDAEMDISVNR